MKFYTLKRDGGQPVSQNKNGCELDFYRGLLHKSRTAKKENGNSSSGVWDGHLTGFVALCVCAHMLASQSVKLYSSYSLIMSGGASSLARFVVVRYLCCFFFLFFFTAFPLRREISIDHSVCLRWCWKEGSRIWSVKWSNFLYHKGRDMDGGRGNRQRSEKWTGEDEMRNVR